MGKIKRNLSTPEGRAFWESAERVAKEVESWPAWKRAGINVSDVRTTEAVPSRWCKLIAMSKQISVGDVVQLKSGGPLMTVNHITEDVCHCQWFYCDNVLVGSFNVNALDKVSTGGLETIIQETIEYFNRRDEEKVTIMWVEDVTDKEKRRMVVDLLSTIIPGHEP